MPDFIEFVKTYEKTNLFLSKNDIFLYDKKIIKNNKEIFTDKEIISLKCNNKLFKEKIACETKFFNIYNAYKYNTWIEELKCDYLCLWERDIDIFMNYLSNNIEISEFYIKYSNFRIHELNSFSENEIINIMTKFINSDKISNELFAFLFPNCVSIEDNDLLIDNKRRKRILRNISTTCDLFFCKYPIYFFKKINFLAYLFSLIYNSMFFYETIEEQIDSLYLYCKHESSKWHCYEDSLYEFIIERKMYIYNMFSENNPNNIPFKRMYYYTYEQIDNNI
jgi:hypothetical protein